MLEDSSLDLVGHAHVLELLLFGLSRSQDVAPPVFLGLLLFLFGLLRFLGFRR